jgi:hypothetical protein
MRHKHRRTWVMARKQAIEENEKLTGFDMEYGEKY